MSLIGVACSNGWTEAATLRCPNAVRLVVQISNAPVRYQLGRGYPGGQVIWESDERPLLPVIGGLERRCDAIRFRNMNANQTAYVDCDALTSLDLPEGAS